MDGQEIPSPNLSMDVALDEEQRITKIFSSTELNKMEGGPTWKPPNKKSDCTWHAKADPQTDPHTHKMLTEQMKQRLKVVSDVSDLIGETPMVRLARIEKREGLECELYGKCEFLSCGGSVKDRIAKRMVEDAENRGLLKPGVSTIIEPTSGNTGIGLALMAAIRGYRCIIVMPEKMSNEKVFTLRALGAEIIRTPNEARFDSPESHISLAQRLNAQIKDSIILDQYTNPSNPLAHYDGTANEILTQMNGQLDLLVAAPGTGGTVTGLGRRLKEVLPDCKIVAPDPLGSSMAPSHMNKDSEGHFYEVEGIGYDFMPTVFDPNIVDIWHKSNDKDSLEYARLAIRLEGLLCGGSSGANLHTACLEAKKLKRGQKCVVILPDSIRNYMTKFLSDDWMIERGFLEESTEVILPEQKWMKKKVSDIDLKSPFTIGTNVTCQEALNLMSQQNFDQIPIIKDSGEIVGVATIGNIMAKVLAGKVLASDTVEKVAYKQFRKVRPNCKMARLSKILETEPYALIVQEQKQFVPSGETLTKEVIVAIVTPIDLVNFVTNYHEKHSGKNNGNFLA